MKDVSVFGIAGTLKKRMERSIIIEGFVKCPQSSCEEIHSRYNESGIEIGYCSSCGHPLSSKNKSTIEDLQKQIEELKIGMNTSLSCAQLGVYKKITGSQSAIEAQITNACECIIASNARSVENMGLITGLNRTWMRSMTLVTLAISLSTLILIAFHVD